MSAPREWTLAGTYLEACNCDAICPCRRIGGRSGGRSTLGVCFGALSWQILEGSADGLDLSGQRVVLLLRYDDDEPGSPWDFLLYLEESALHRSGAPARPLLPLVGMPLAAGLTDPSPTRPESGLRGERQTPGG